MKQFHHQIYNRHDHTDRRADTSKDRRQAQTDLRIGGHTEHGRIVQTVEIVVGLSGPALRLLIRNLLTLIAKLRHNAPQEWGRIIQLPQHLDKIPVIKPGAGKMLDLLHVRKLLDGLIDIYLPDMKYMDSSLSLKYSNAKDYFDVASKALDEMFKQVGKPVFDKRGIMKRGMIVRHLILPGMTYDSKNVIKYLYETFKDDIYISIMNQYTPLKQVEKYPEINRKVTDKEYDECV